jgi:hypothetical protein
MLSRVQGQKNRGGGVHIAIKRPQNFPNFPDEQGITCGAAMRVIVLENGRKGRFLLAHLVRSWLCVWCAMDRRSECFILRLVVTSGFIGRFTSHAESIPDQRASRKLAGSRDMCWEQGLSLEAVAQPYL